VEFVTRRGNANEKVGLLRGVSRETAVCLDARGRKLDRDAHLQTRNNEIVAVLNCAHNRGRSVGKPRAISSIYADTFRVIKCN